MKINKNEIIKYVEKNEEKYSNELVKNFLDISAKSLFWKI